jgi:hypothetical protein
MEANLGKCLIVWDKSFDETSKPLIERLKPFFYLIKNFNHIET